MTLLIPYLYIFIHDFYILYMNTDMKSVFITAL